MLEIILVRLLALVGAIALSYWVYRKITYGKWEKKAEFKQLKKAVEIAQKTEGSLTASDLSFEMDIPLDEADSILTKLVSQGLATTEVGDTGTIIYDVPKAKQKVRA